MGAFQTVFACDFYRPAVACYKANFPNVDCRYADIRSITEFPNADIVIGGPPCQPFSVAGKKLGTDDPRNMIPEFVRVVSTVKPRQFLMENVRGYFRSEYRAQVEKQLTELGYRVETRLLNAADYGVPSRRERSFTWGIRADVPGTHHWPKQAEKWISVREAIGTPTDIFPYENKHHFNGTNRKYNITEPGTLDKPAATITAQDDQRSRYVWVSPGMVHEFTIDELRTLMSVPKYFKWAENQSLSSMSHIIGNGWASKMGTLFAEAFHVTDPQSVTIIDLFCGGGLGAIGWHDWKEAVALKEAA